MDQSEILGIVAIVISVGGSILGVINHKRIRSKCCGRELSASLDIEASTPPPRIHASVVAPLEGVPENNSV